MIATCVVTSKGRAGLTNGTVSHLLTGGARSIVIACPMAEMKAYERTWTSGVHVIGVPAAERGLSALHQEIVDMGWNGKVIIFDDDLRFAARENVDIKVPGLHPANPLQILGMLTELTELLNEYAHAGISERFMNQGKDTEVCEAAKMISVMALRTDILKRERVRLDRVVSKNDFDVTLQLLEKGYPNAILSRYTHDQLGGPTLPGGNTETRTLAVHAQASKQLAALHPYTVKIVEKEADRWGVPRVDVTVRWKKAYEAGLLLEGCKYPLL